MGTMLSTQAPTWRMEDRLRRAIDEADISIGEIATQLGLSRQTIGSYVNGRSIPSRATLMAWASLTGVPFGWLTGEDQ